MTVTPEGRLVVSRRIRDEFSDGRQYYALDGKAVRAPDDPAARPDPTQLRWHNEAVFLA